MLSIKFIETIVNKTLSLDPKTAQFLKNLHGKILKIEIQTLKRNFWIIFKEKGIQIITKEERIAEVMMSGPLKAFLILAFTKNPHAAIRAGLSFEGDVEILEILQSLFSSLDIDWEEHLSPWTGDIVAHQVGQLVRFTKKRQKELSQVTKESLSEYLTEEIKILPTRSEIDDFLEAVDVLRADIERLFLKIERIQ